MNGVQNPWSVGVAREASSVSILANRSGNRAGNWPGVRGDARWQRRGPNIHQYESVFLAALGRKITRVKLFWVVLTYPDGLLSSNGVDW